MVPSITFRAIVVLPETKMRIRSTIAHLQPSFSGAWRCAASACVWLLALAWLPLALPSTSLCCHRFHCDLSLRCLQPRSRCIVVDSCINVILTMTANTTTATAPATTSRIAITTTIIISAATYILFLPLQKQA